MYHDDEIPNQENNKKTSAYPSLRGGRIFVIFQVRSGSHGHTARVPAPHIIHNTIDSHINKFDHHRDSKAWCGVLHRFITPDQTRTDKRAGPTGFIFCFGTASKRTPVHTLAQTHTRVWVKQSRWPSHMCDVLRFGRNHAGWLLRSAKRCITTTGLTRERVRMP